MLRFAKDLVRRLRIVGEFLQFLKERKLWWITPMVLTLLLIGLLLITAQSSPLSSFIYAMF